MNDDNLTPMMRQYMDVKKQYKNCVLLFRLGDFYEMFFEDAHIAERELELTLTGRDCGGGNRAPMCGIPYHAAQPYIAKLVSNGYKVAVCDQLEEAAKGKTLVKRDVTRVVTAGTVTDDALLDSAKNNYIACVCDDGRRFGFAMADVTTGAFMVYETPKPAERAEAFLTDELARIGCAELLVNDKFAYKLTNVIPQTYERRAFDFETAKARLTAHFKVANLTAFGVPESDKAAVKAGGALLTYLYETQKIALSHITKLAPYHREKYMALDASSRRNLELTKSTSGQKKGSLLWVLDETKTAAGARALTRWLEQPLLEVAEILARQDSVEQFYNAAGDREDLRVLLTNVRDIERLVSKTVYGSATPRDFLSIKSSLCVIPQIRDILSEHDARLLRYFASELDPCDDVSALINRAISDDPPAVREPGFVRDGYSAELDGYRAAKRDGRGWLMELEAKERQASGIKSLKVKYNKVFGFYFEITNSNLSAAPSHFIRRQTLANCERFVTEELRQIEDKLTSADAEIERIEQEIYAEIRRAIADEAARILASANMLAAVDALQSLAESAAKNNYVKPKITETAAIKIYEGRHPVVERFADGGFVPNNTIIDTAENRMLIITGPNMAGKSTYMRQVALIVILAQIGSFVPAKRAEIGVCDRVFTRVGASDDLATGQSTFMVEMNEVANILNNATPKSLLILDEIGRGTSTFDGLSIAWAVLEHIADAKRLGARTLFATHYHELTELEGKVNGVINYHATVHESGGEIAFLRKIKRGAAGHSYGVEVAKLAGLPPRVLARAREILRLLDSADIAKAEGDDYGAAKLSDKLAFAEILSIDADEPPLVVVEKLRELQARLAIMSGGVPRE